MADRVYDRKEMFLGDLATLTCAFLWGVSFMATKEVLVYMGPLWLLTLRFGFSAFLIGIVSPRRIRHMTRRDGVRGGTIGLLLLVAMVLQTIGLQYTTTGKSAFITACCVVMVPFSTWAVARKSPGLKPFIASGICLVGIGIISLDGALRPGLGEMLTLMCAVGFALQIVAIDRLAQGRDALTLSMVEMGLSAVACLIGALIMEPLPRLDSLTGLWWLVYLSVGCTLIPYSLQIKAQQLTSPTHVTLLLMMESVFAMIIGVIFLGEALTLRLVMGCGLIFVSILIAELDLIGWAKQRGET
ncbi:MAG: EamA family transporter [Dethiosulfovibrio peptidovorans]|nr:MAG: EamA family transporter [Dethiosulfovibrio peptidovorans]